MRQTAFEVTSESQLEPCEVDHTLNAWRAGEGVHWIHLEASGPEDLDRWLDALELTPFLRTRLLKAGSVSKVVAVREAVVVDVPVLVEACTRRQVAALCLNGLLVTLEPEGGAEDRSEELRKMEIFERSSAGMLCSLLLREADRTAREHLRTRERVLLLDARMDREPGEVKLDEILSQKERMLHLLSVAEEQLECCDALARVKSEVWSAADLEEVVGLLVSVTGSTDRKIDRLEKRVADLRQRYDTHQADRTNHRLGILTVLSAVFLPLSLFAGIWGMNFESMPELKIPSAYPVALSLMALIAGGMLWFFYRRGWFR